jgi:hypothetical protein
VSQPAVKRLVLLPLSLSYGSQVGCSIGGTSELGTKSSQGWRRSGQVTGTFLEVSKMLE